MKIITIRFFFSTEVRLKMLTDEYEEKLREQESENSARIRTLSKELNSKFEEKERAFQLQIDEIIRKNNFFSFRRNFLVVFSFQKKVTKTNEFSSKN